MKKFLASATWYPAYLPRVGVSVPTIDNKTYQELRARAHGVKSGKPS